MRANGDVSLILSNSPPDNPSTDDIIVIIDYVCGYACKDSEPTGATSDLFKDMLNAVDEGDTDQVKGKSMCAKMLIKAVGRRDISGPEASFELSGLAELMVKLQLAAPHWISTLHDYKMNTVLGTTLHLRTVIFLL